MASKPKKILHRAVKKFLFFVVEFWKGPCFRENKSLNFEKPLEIGWTFQKFTQEKIVKLIFFFLMNFLGFEVMSPKLARNFFLLAYFPYFCHSISTIKLYLLTV